MGQIEQAVFTSARTDRGADTRWWRPAPASARQIGGSWPSGVPRTTRYRNAGLTAEVSISFHCPAAPFAFPAPSVWDGSTAGGAALGSIPIASLCPLRSSFSLQTIH